MPLLYLCVPGDHMHLRREVDSFHILRLDRWEAQGSKWLDASVAGRRHGKRLYVDLEKMKYVQ
jgi:hypothetical protein